MSENFQSENPPIRVLVSTRNAHKVAEIRAILGGSFDVVDLTAVPSMPAIDEIGATFEENATLKAVGASARFDGWVIADDSGLEVDALDGAPGVRSARFAGPNATDAENNALLMERLASVPDGQRRARFRCVIVVARAGRKLAAFDGAIEGRITSVPLGEGGFGYDPLFVPEGFAESFGQLDATAKNTTSHRARASAKLRAWRGWC
jgi:XTP/dITP diphosphohydrolase